MSTVIRPELSKKNKWFIEKYRYLELKNFCRQFPIWEKAYQSLNALSKKENDIIQDTQGFEDKTAKTAIAMEFYSKRMDMIKDTCKEADPEIADYILIGVTKGVPYDIIQVNYDIPCSRDTYYDRYRKFFYLLNKARE